MRAEPGALTYVESVVTSYLARLACENVNEGWGLWSVVKLLLGWRWRRKRRRTRSEISRRIGPEQNRQEIADTSTSEVESR